jgi:glutathione-regulated potassium-efflux system protein KefB
LKLLGSLGVVIIAGRYLIRPVFKIVARTGLAEMSTATALLVVMGTVWLMSQAGVSMALGAFLAGLLLAESEYKHELESQIEPFKGLLLALFFMSVGMSADLTLLVESPLVIVGLTVLLILIKMPVLMLIGRFLEGVDKDSALKLGLVLAAGGEFAFVVFQQGRIAGLFSAHNYDILVLTITLSMALIPVLMLAQSKIRRRRAVAEQEVPSPYKDIDADAPRVVIAGMGRVGPIIARILRAQNIPFIALDTSVETTELIRSFEGVPVFYGDPLRPEILRAAKVGSAEYFMIATDDQDVSVQTAQLVRRLYPHIKIIARARNRHHAHRLTDEGVEAFREAFHSSLEMSRSALQGLGLTRTQADFRLRQFAEHDEKVLETQRTIRDDVAKVLQNTHEARLELTKLFESDTHSHSSKKRGRWRSKVSVHRMP